MGGSDGRATDLQGRKRVSGGGERGRKGEAAAGERITGSDGMAAAGSLPASFWIFVLFLSSFSELGGKWGGRRLSLYTSGSSVPVLAITRNR
jgi:hypothetical protein